MGHTFAAQAAAELTRWEVELLPLIRDALGQEKLGAVRAALPEQLGRLLRLMPDPGWRAPQMRSFSASGAIYIAVYLVLKQHGLTAAQVWALCEEATRHRFTRMSALSRWLLSKSMFSALWKLLSRRLAARSQRQPVGGWQVEYLPSRAGEFDYGVTYTRCAIFQLAQDAGASEFAPFICQADIVGSDAFAWGLRRTETLAQGGQRCDFRFRKGRETDVKVRLPVL